MPFMLFSTPITGGKQLTITMRQCATTKQYTVTASTGTNEFDQQVVRQEQVGNFNDACAVYAESIANEMRRNGYPMRSWIAELHDEAKHAQSTMPLLGAQP